ncbi:MAG: Glu-tRNA(Gln) amidotransferase subunit GatE [Candidatus Woesearchaeota archaeon]|nr:Glu-tRNA(Gln) amidotransferase subunit GatE [Candidatus Woesearchaeota archaeon]
MSHDYAQLGLRMGLEIHQQLEGKKLFCLCPTTIRKDEPDFEVRRRLRVSAGETGAVDIAAQHEEEKKKYFSYRGYHNSTCLVELDEEPPALPNHDALQTCLQLCKLLHCEVVDAIQFMRKTVIDGSNTSGFQRTALIGTDGYVDVDGKKIGIATVCLEEEACQVIERTKEYDVYNLSRLGIPLIEIATAPDITTPEECKKTALMLGMILRSVPSMKRGIGSIRQDVNLSIKNGHRVEIKGFQEVQSLPKVVDGEIERQLKEKKGESHVRKAEPDGTTSFLRPMPGAARMYPETDVIIIIPDFAGTGDVRLLSEKADELQKLGLSKDLAEKIAKSEQYDLFGELKTACTTVKPSFIAEVLVSYPAEVKKTGGDAGKIVAGTLRTVFIALDAGTIAKPSLMALLVDVSKGLAFDVHKYELISDKELEEEIKHIVKESKELPFNAVLGKAMGKLKGKAEAQKIIELLKKMK